MATALLVRCHLSILSDFVEQVRGTPGTFKTENFLDLSANRQDCEALADAARISNDTIREVEAHLFAAHFCAIERSSSRFEAAQALKNEAELHMDIEVALREGHRDTVSNLKHTRAEITAVEESLEDGTFFSFVTTEERRAVLAAIANEFKGTGHWYYCAIGHSFTIGEYVWSMEKAKCPICGATVGLDEGIMF
ncbi:hypothetical protein K432DRAFT_385611 [Lepidopterella palustris CBS 459.81]|uniref:RZ-type domain-containing protein n=1 Tax=Lepidopterella palustris CBS 459.81 TaxID=1314670 RepID=A0A8E2E2S5_9PEZI|nr:hypothetical protein K432DRAFT_385611 [Lepidopterella palustris CBS 459.81]